MSASAEREQRTLGFREALGSHWGFGQTARLLTIPPAAALVVLQEVSVPFSSPALVLLSVLAQTALVTLIAAPLAGHLRRTGRTLPVWLVLTAWAGIGAGRGFAGGAAALLDGSDPDFGFRVVFWALTAALWMPLLAYVLAQLAHRRLLLTTLADAEEDLQLARVRAARTQRQVRDRVVSALHATVTPAIREIRSRLAAVAQDPTRFTEIGSRLGTASHDVSRIVETLSADSGLGSVSAARRPAPMAAALAFERRRPLLWATGAATGVALALGPLAARSGNVDLLLELAAAITTSTIALVATSEVSGRSSRLRRSVRVRDLAPQALAASAGSLVLAGFQGDRPEAFPLLLLVALPLTLLFAVGLISITVGSGTANADLAALLDRVEDERRCTDARTTEEESRIRRQLTTLTHGPIQGRLAACSMALSFHAAEGESASPERTAYIAGAVLAHLDDVMTDLADLRRAARVPNTRLIAPAPVVSGVLSS
ncbi:hypothetical protein [Naasia sp. SYSU D00057]|uniref:hypothetical protein n=1 Tax=Naasia sp. SYSU D00057 TaxID=2817380 RepID=UPI001B317A49|nr:hypothetical protein [Naasia sp. SYSU D00057]